ncbi:MAG: glycosyltransferase [Pseudomonadota bacterium]
MSLLRVLPRILVRPVERTLIGIRGADLFDREFYRAHHDDIRDADADPLGHYLRYGWREGRAVNPRFDDGHYRVESGLVRGAPVSALAHYLAFGRRQGLCPVPGVSLASHEASVPGIAVARMDPYRHLLGSPPAPSESLDEAEITFRLRRLTRPVGVPEVAVVMPVYLGRLETLNAICHVLEAECTTHFELIVVNDASPDAELAADLRHASESVAFRLLECEENMGFVAATNLGCAEAGMLDVVWLNSDTEVYDGWLDRLRRAAYAQPNIATVTPLSNNGTICSYPRTNTDNPGVLELSWRELDAVAAAENAGVVVETPTAVGFATYVRRAALDAVGPLDVATFGRGYGEENDFSQRAINAGFRNLIAADVLVRHFGAMSFRGSRADRIEAALKVLDRRHPGYHAAVARFLAEDPVLPSRHSLDRVRLNRLKGSRNILLITHSSGGGTLQHVQEEAARLSAEGASVFYMMGGSKGAVTARLAHVTAGPLPSFSAMALADGALWDMLRALDLDEIHVHHLLDFGARGPSIFQNALEKLSVPYRFVLHDYLPVCPRVNMADLKGMYCGAPELSECQRCVDRRGSRVGRLSVAAWRATHLRILERAIEVGVPDEDVEQRLRSYFPTLYNIVTRPHEPPEALKPRRVGAREPGPIRIAVLGAIGPTKGFDVLLALAAYCRSSGHAVELTVIGYTRDDIAAEAGGITVTGAYINSEVDAVIDRVDPDLIWIPSTWPETYSYTLSIALRSGRPVAAFAIGALGSRLRGVERGVRIPLHLSTDPAALWARLREAARPVESGLSESLV